MNSLPSQFKILGIDPGITNGFALALVNIVDKTIEWKVWETHIDEFSLHLGVHEPDIVVIEDFILRPDKRTEFMNKGFTSLETAKLVGRAEQWCYEHGRVCSIAQASDKKFAYSLLGETYVKGKKNMHKMDAKAHARHYIRKRWVF